MLTDPQSITVATVAHSMPKISNSGMHSFYQSLDTLWSLDITHRVVTRDKKRRVVSLAVFTQKKVVPDPLTSVNDYETLSESLQIDRPEAGFTSTEVSDQWTGLSSWLSASSNAIVLKLYGRES
uniref:Uncharacterized protein n=1 Tax=Leviviridae sp. TaxID=2027243 RepID=A0A514D8R2_9VIRU|nr:MAG: hypothetical protein H1RhizoL1215e3415_000004 [Leviviridae sp.]